MSDAPTFLKGAVKSSSSLGAISAAPAFISD
jgi:hypothetical protein